MTDTRWLTEQQLHAWRGFLGAAIEIPAALDTRMRAGSDLSLFEYLVLAMLSEELTADEREHVASMSDLATKSHSSLSRLSHAVKRLEQRGLIERFPSPQNGRVTLARLTAAGLADLVAAAPDHVAAVQEAVFDRLDAADVAALARIAEKLNAVPCAGGTSA